MDWSHHERPGLRGTVLAVVLAAMLLLPDARLRAAELDAPPAPQQQPDAGSDRVSPPSMREDEPAPGNGDPKADSDTGASPPGYRGGCPYRGKSLELIV